MRGIVMGLMIAVSGCSATTAAAAIPDRGRAAVVDVADALPEEAERALNDRVVSWNRSTGHQLAVAIVPDMGGQDVKTYGYQLGRAWKLGDAKRNDGVLLLLAMRERKVRIDVGYGLEPALTDARTGQIIRFEIVPKLTAGDVPAAIAAGADAIMATLPASAVVPHPTGRDDRSSSWWWLPYVLSLLAGGVIAFWLRRQMRGDRQEAQRALETAQRHVRARYHALGGRTPAVTTPPAKTLAVAPSPADAGSGWATSSSSSSSSSPSSSSSSSSSGFDSGGGSFGGGGSDSSW